MKLDSIDLHLDHLPVPVNVDAIVDTTGGEYPAYYTIKDGKLLVCTSVYQLIGYLGSFELNPEYQYAQDIQFHTQYITVDKRIKRVMPFEKVTAHTSEIIFHPTFEKKNVSEYLQDSAKYLVDFVNEIEERYPKKTHIVLTGGKDSRMMWLIPKKNPEKWVMFCSQPDLYYVKDWMLNNKIPFPTIYEHDGFPDETYEFFKKKVIAADANVELRHARWMEREVELAKKYNDDVIFWIGDTGFNFNFNAFSTPAKRDWFDTVNLRASLYHGTKNQIIKNLTNCPRLSMYHSPKIQTEVFQYFDADLIDKDYRFELANLIAGRKIVWENPYQNINWWTYPFDYDVKQIYLDAIKERINGRQKA